jgi:hypothetical protein
MADILNIVERAYQGTLEEQDDQALWLIHALRKAGGEHRILLRGPATAYAVKGQGGGAVSIAGIQSGNPARPDQDLGKLAAAGVPIHAVREDAEERGISEPDVIPELHWISRAEVPTLIREARRVFAW